MIVNAVSIEPGKRAEKKQICTEPAMLKFELGASAFEMTYPFEDKSIALVQNENRIVEGLAFNRALIYSDDGESVKEVIQGKALIVKTKDRAMVNLSDDEAQELIDKFYYPEFFLLEDGKLSAIKYEPTEQNELLSPSLLNELWEGKYNPQQIRRSKEYLRRTSRFNKAVQEMLCVITQSTYDTFNEVLEAAASVFAFEKKAAYGRGIDFGRRMYSNVTQ
jgi:hypothetical protein